MVTDASADVAHGVGSSEGPSGMSESETRAEPSRQFRTKPAEHAAALKLARSM
jgi:hypothetical protein